MALVSAASDPAIRAAMKTIARDETRHEVDALVRRQRRSPHVDLVRVAGVPDAARAVALATKLQETLWRA